MGLKDGIIVVAAAAGPAFAAANQPYTEPAQAATPPHAACIVRLNRYTDTAIDDERFLTATLSTAHESRLRSSGSMSGITYIQHGTLASHNEAWHHMDKGPTTLDMAFLSTSALNGRLMEHGRYYESSTQRFGYDIGIIASMPQTNWTTSYQVEVQDPTICLNIRHSLLSWPPDYRTGPTSGLWTNMPLHTSDSFAEAQWAKTGYSSNPADLKTNPSVTIIPRDERLKQDAAAGQPMDSNGMAPFKPLGP